MYVYQPMRVLDYRDEKDNTGMDTITGEGGRVAYIPTPTKLSTIPKANSWDFR